MSRWSKKKKMKLYTKHSACAAWAYRGGKSTRKGAESGVGRREWIKQVSGMKDRDERSRGMEIRMADAFATIEPT